MTELIATYGLALIFANVLLERAGLPLPATPTLLICGALAMHGKLAPAPVFAVALAACTLGDTLWYAAGWFYGRRIMSLLCRISLSPDSCVRQSENRFARWGRLTLVLAKFVPGLSTVARPMAGAMRLRFWSFELLNGVGSVLWIAGTLIVGMLFHTQINGLLLRLRDLGAAAGELLAVVLLVYIALKWWERRRHEALLRIARVSVDELRHLLTGDDVPVVVDVRSPITRTQDRRCIPGAVEMSLDEVLQRLEELPPHRQIVFYCACPNEASAAMAARKLMEKGYIHVRPLRGGLDAWIAAGYDVEDRPAVLIATSQSPTKGKAGDSLNNGTPTTTALQ